MFRVKLQRRFVKFEWSKGLLIVRLTAEHDPIYKTKGVIKLYSRLTTRLNRLHDKTKWLLGKIMVKKLFVYI